MPKTTRSDLRRIDNIVSKQLVMFRVARNLSQTELGAKAFVTFQQIQKYEKGSNSMPSGRMRMLCNALGITPNDLFGIDADETKVAPALSPWAYKLAFRLDKLGSGVRVAVSHLVDGLVEHAAQEQMARVPVPKVPIRR